MFDKFHDECGVFAIYGHPEAANLAYLGLYAMQHRGQESAGIASSDGRHIHNHKSMGHVADIFTPEVLGTLPGELAIGHTRYSTAGDTVLLNAQPFSVACNKGQVAVAHNGNITNAAELRRDLEREGSIFQASSDTEVILHLVARSRERTLPGALREALLQLEGAFSLVFLAEDRIIIARDPHGFRPLAFGQMELSGGSICYVFASETCQINFVHFAQPYPRPTLLSKTVRSIGNLGPLSVCAVAFGSLIIGHVQSDDARQRQRRQQRADRNRPLPAARRWRFERSPARSPPRSLRDQS